MRYFRKILLTTFLLVIYSPSSHGTRFEGPTIQELQERLLQVSDAVHRDVQHIVQPFEFRKFMDTRKSSNEGTKNITDCVAMDVEIVTEEHLFVPAYHYVGVKGRDSYDDYHESLYKALISYEIQSKICKFNVANIEDFGNLSREGSQGIIINKNNVADFIERMRPYVHVELRSADWNIRYINYILNMTLKTKTQIICQIEKNSIKVKGYVVKLSSLYSIDQCRISKLQSIKLYAFETVFIDVNFTFINEKHLQLLTIISPNVEFVNNASINLTGIDADAIPKKSAEIGKLGLPGLPGQPGRNFFIVAQYINYLDIDVSGGKGGKGQAGGRGRDGKDGDYTKDVLNLLDRAYGISVETGEPKAYRYETNRDCKNLDHSWIGCWKNPGNSVEFWCKTRSCCNFYVYGEAGHQGKHGLDGGAGGIGGSPGNVLIWSFQSGEYIIHNNTGLAGNCSAGALGGNGGEQMKAKFLWCDHYWDFTKFAAYHGSDVISQAAKGSSGRPCQNRKNMILPKSQVPLEPLEYLNEYILNSLEVLGTPLKIDEFLDFIYKKIDNNSLITINSLFVDLEILEKSFYKLHWIDFLPRYKKLLDRIKSCTSRCSDIYNSGSKKALQYLLVATISRINSFTTDTILIKNINEYFRSLDINFKNLKILKDDNMKLTGVVKKMQTINNEKEKYTNSINAIVKQAHILIEHQVFPEFNRISKKMQTHLELLVTEIDTLKNESEKRIRILAKKRDELKRMLPLHIFFNILATVVGPILSIFGPIGVAVGTAVTAVGAIGSHFTKVNPLKPMVSNSPQITDKLFKRLKTIQNTKSETLNGTLRMLNTIPGISSSIVGGNVTYTYKVSNRKNVKSHQSKKSLEVAAQVERVGAAGVISIAENVENHLGAVGEIDKAIYQERKKIAMLDNLKDQVYQSIMPSVQNMVGTVKDVAKTLDLQPIVILDALKYEVVKLIDEFKFNLGQVTKGFGMQEDLKECFNNFKAAFTHLTTLYERIKSYEDNKKFASYIGNLITAIASDSPVPSEFEVHISYLELLICSNLIKQQINTAFDALKQFVFPFAHLYFRNQKIPPYLYMEKSIENLVFESAKQVSFIKSKLDEHLYSIKQLDSAFGTGRFNSKYYGSQPFFVWQNKLHKLTINRLLLGREVVLEANILHSTLNFHAVKFKNLDLKFKLASGRDQSELDNVMKAFSVSMTHMGDSHYQYDNKTYLMRTKHLEFWFSFEKISGDQPLFKNEVYRKLETGDFMLSPFATWQIKIGILTPNKYNITYEHLKKYKNKLNVELCGVGYFVRPNIIPSKELFVDDYYDPI